jgi:predicted RNase H-like HicB family nuclease
MKTGTLKTFSVIYEPAEEGGFVASVPTLPGCFSQGDTFEEAQANITEAIDLYLETVGSDTNAPALPIVGTVSVYA